MPTREAISILKNLWENMTILRFQDGNAHLGSERSNDESVEYLTILRFQGAHTHLGNNRNTEESKGIL